MNLIFYVSAIMATCITLVQTKMKVCTSTEIRNCQCPPGKYKHVYPGNTGFCKTHRICPGLTLEAGTPWKDTVCDDTTSVSEPHSTTLPPTTATHEITPSTTSNITVPHEKKPGGIYLSPGEIAGLVIGTFIAALIIYDICLYVKEKRGVLWSIKQKLIRAPGGDGTRNIEEEVDMGQGENREPLLTETKVEEVNEMEVRLLETTNEDNGEMRASDEIQAIDLSRSDEMQGIRVSEMEDTLSPDEIQTIELSVMKERSLPIEPQSPFVPKPEDTIVRVHPVTAETESHNNMHSKRRRTLSG